jgi:cation-transporting ATPase 13A3/4/5
MVEEGYATTLDVTVSVLDLVTCVVPPALPTCLQIGVSMGVWRLRTKKIFCISPQKVNIAGKISVMCFDKTGTLTEDGLDLNGIASVNYSHNAVVFSPVHCDLA